VIDDEEHERVHERVAAVDVAKDSGMVCVRAPHPSRTGARRCAIWTVQARMNTIRQLGRQLNNDGIEIVTLESTSGYWRIWFFVLEACGLAAMPPAWGVNADGTTGPHAGTGPDDPVLPAVRRLAQIPGMSEDLARSVIAETGLDMSRFVTARHLVSQAGLCPSARQSGSRTRAGRKARATRGCAGPSARPPPARPAPIPYWASGTGGSPAAAARPRPRSPPPGPSWSSSGSC
jgi:hypothetical protein